MSRYDREDTLVVLALVLDAAAVSVLVLAVGGFAASTARGPSIATSVWIALIFGPFLCSFLLTILMRRATHWSLATGWPVVLLAFGLIPTLVTQRATSLPTSVILRACVVGWLTGFVGVLAAKQLGPAWRWLKHRLRSLTDSRLRRPPTDPWRRRPPAEPQCPHCQYVLYFAANQTCPECGRPFNLQEVDVRLARWDGHVLLPREEQGASNAVQDGGPS